MLCYSLIKWSTHEKNMTYRIAEVNTHTSGGQTDDPLWASTGNTTRYTLINNMYLQKFTAHRRLTQRFDQDFIQDEILFFFKAGIMVAGGKIAGAAWRVGGVDAAEVAA